MKFNSDIDVLKCGLKMGLKSLVIEVCDTLYATYLIDREELLAKEIEKLKEVLIVYWKYFFLPQQERFLKTKCTVSREHLHVCPVLRITKRQRETTKEMISQIVGDVYTPMNQGLFWH